MIRSFCYRSNFNKMPIEIQQKSADWRIIFTDNRQGVLPKSADEADNDNRICRLYKTPCTRQGRRPQSPTTILSSWFSPFGLTTDPDCIRDRLKSQTAFLKCFMRKPDTTITSNRASCVQRLRNRYVSAARRSRTPCEKVTASIPVAASGRFFTSTKIIRLPRRAIISISARPV